MEIIKQQSGHVLELKIKGRLDASWADYLDRELENVLREGVHHIVLNVSDVSYISSAGVRIFIKYDKQLKEILGSFAIFSPSDAVKKVLTLVGLDSMIISEIIQPVGKTGTEAISRLEYAGTLFETFDETPQATLNCRLLGNTGRLNGFRFHEEHLQTISLPPSTFAIGLGAFGHDFNDSQNRFGEFLAVAGAAAYLPTDVANVPDFMISSGSFVPSLGCLYGMLCEGRFSHRARFEVKKETHSIPLTDLCDICFDIAGMDTLGLIIIAESAGLVGAALRCSPALTEIEDAPFHYPQIRDWLTFTPEKTFVKNLALVVGVVTRNSQEVLRPFVRSLGKDSDLVGHFHAAAFSYRPLRKTKLQLHATVNTLFETEHLQGVLHLLYDDRHIVGIGGSEFIAGSCWFAPISNITVEGN